MYEQYGLEVDPRTPTPGKREDVEFDIEAADARAEADDTEAAAPEAQARAGDRPTPSRAMADAFAEMSEAPTPVQARSQLRAETGFDPQVGDHG